MIFSYDLLHADCRRTLKFSECFTPHNHLRKSLFPNQFLNAGTGEDSPCSAHKSNQGAFTTWIEVVFVPWDGNSTKYRYFITDYKYIYLYTDIADISYIDICFLA